MKDKKLILTKHAADRFLEREIPLELIRKMLKRGVRLEDPDGSGKILCIYKESKRKHYTLVIDETPQQTTIITGYESSAWQVRYYQKNKVKK